MSTLELKLISDPTKFISGVAKSTKALKDLDATAKKIGGGINKALGAIGIGTAFSDLTNLIKESSKAAVEDTKSKQMLALALQNTVGAGQAAISSTEKWIAKTQLATSVVDEKLRPALASAVRVTGDLSKGQGLVKLALDVSAGSGVDLDTVMRALNKAYDGNIGSLKRLGISIKDANNWQQELKDSFDGSAEAAANLDPYARLQVIFDDMKETIGNALNPYLKQFADYLASPKGQEQLQNIARIFVHIAVVLGSIIGFLVQNWNWLQYILIAWVAIRTAIVTSRYAMILLKGATELARVAANGLRMALIKSGWGAILVAIGELAAAMGWLGSETEGVNTALELTAGQLAAIKKLAVDATWEIDQFGNVWSGGKIIFDPAAFESQKQAALQAIADAKDRIVKAAEKFRDSVGLAFGVTGKDEFAIFNMDKAMAKLTRMVNAARGFGSNVQKLIKAGAGQDIINELVAMGPAQGNIVAKGLLASGQLSEYIGLRQSLYNTGFAVQTQAESAKTSYTFNISTDMTGQEIIKLIQTYEKKTGKKYFVNG